MRIYFCSLVFMLMSSNYAACAYSALEAEIVIVDERVLFSTKRWKKPREAFVFLVKHQKELPVLTRIAIVLAYKKMRGQSLSVARVLKEFKELQRYKDEIYEFIALENPHEGVIAVLEQLRALGKKVFFATAMLPESYEYNKQRYAEVFAHCDEVIFVSASLFGRYDIDYFAHVQNLVSNKDSQAQNIMYLDARKEKHALKNRNQAAHYGIECVSVEALEKEINSVALVKFSE